MDQYYDSGIRATPHERVEKCTTVAMRSKIVPLPIQTIGISSDGDSAGSGSKGFR